MNDVAAHTNARCVKLARPAGPQRQTPVKAGVQRTRAQRLRTCDRAPCGATACGMRLLAQQAGGVRKQRHMQPSELQRGGWQPAAAEAAGAVSHLLQRMKALHEP